MGKIKFYDGKHIVKRETIDDVIIETFIEVKDGVVFLEKYMNFVCIGKTVIADLAKEIKNDILQAYINCILNGEAVIVDLAKENNNDISG